MGTPSAVGAEPTAIPHQREASLAFRDWTLCTGSLLEALVSQASAALLEELALPAQLARLVCILWCLGLCSESLEAFTDIFLRKLFTFPYP